MSENILKEYFDYVESEEATVVYIAKNLVNQLETNKKWINVVDFDCWGSKGGKLAFNYIIVELFDRKVFPKYPKGADLKLKKAITWHTAHKDIEQQRLKGIRGPMFLITCHLFNKNKGKKKAKLLHNWNEAYGGFDYTGKVPTTTITRKVDMKPEWKYRITGFRKINNNNLLYIQENYEWIYDRILEEKLIKIDWFFED